MCASSGAELKAGVARASITPMEEGIPTQLGGYGDRAGKPAVGIHDTIYAKALVFDMDGKKSALVALDVTHAPWCLVEESLAKAGVAGLTPENALFVSSHDHAGLEGMSMDRRNIANNPHVGIFNEAILEFVSKRVAQAIKEAASRLEPVTAGMAVTPLPGMNRNRRHKDAPTDQDLTVVRFDTAEGRPLAVLVNYTAHGTIMTAEIMEISGGWAGAMQRTFEDLIGGGVTCLYTNGAEGDVSPAGYQGGSRFEMAEGYGRRVAIAAARLTTAIATRPVTNFGITARWVDLPERKAAPDFLKIAGDEYKVTEEQLQMMIGMLFPSRAPLYALRVNDFLMVTFPGEPISEIGLAVKQTLREAGIRFPAVAALTNDLIGYILTKEEYAQSGYEVTASFYGDGLGELMLQNAQALAREAAGM